MKNFQEEPMIKNMFLSTVFIFSLVVIFAGSAMAQSAGEVPSSQTMGKTLFEKFCAECHGKDLGGNDKGPPFLHRFYLPGHHGSASFYKAVKEGVRAHHWNFGDMKPIKNLEEAHVTLIVKYVRYIQNKAGLY